MWKITIVLLLLCVPSLSFAGYRNRTGELPDLDALYGQISQKFQGRCPATVTIKESEIPGISQFNPKTAEILVHKNSSKWLNTIAHETVHLCLNRLSDGAATTPPYRFIDEGYARFYGDNVTIGEDAIRRTAMTKAKKYEQQHLVSFGQVMDWKKYFGNQGKGGVLGFDAYDVGVSFYLYVKDTCGEEAFFKLVAESGKSFTFNGALKAALDRTEEQTEAEWLGFIRAYDLKDRSISTRPGQPAASGAKSGPTD